MTEDYMGPCRKYIMHLSGPSHVHPEDSADYSVFSGLPIKNRDFCEETFALALKNTRATDDGFVMRLCGVDSDPCDS